MGKGKVIVEGCIAAANKLLHDEKFQEMVCGKYSDGTTRSIPDAINGEYMSPKEKKKEMKKIKKRKKKHKAKRFRL